MNIYVVGQLLNPGTKLEIRDLGYWRNCKQKLQDPPPPLLWYKDCFQVSLHHHPLSLAAPKAGEHKLADNQIAYRATQIEGSLG